MTAREGMWLTVASREGFKVGDGVELTRGRGRFVITEIDKSTAPDWYRMRIEPREEPLSSAPEGNPQ